MASSFVGSSGSGPPSSTELIGAKVTQPLVARRDILIEAPLDVVWAVVTQPDHVAAWFSDTVEVELEPGGRAAFHWNDHGTVHGRVERVEPPHLFSFRRGVRHVEEASG